MDKEQYTNKFNLPEEDVLWLIDDTYDSQPNTFSATTLMKPPKIWLLEQEFADKMEIDVSDLIRSRQGTAIHDSYEKVSIPHCMQERRFYVELPVDGKNYIICGKPDFLFGLNQPTQKLKDLKTTSVYSYIYKSKDIDYQTQLSIYRWLLNHNGFEVDDIAYIKYHFTDWSQSKAKNDPSYPQCIKMDVPVTLWGLSETEAYIIDRIRLFIRTQKDYKEKSILPVCTPEDLWQQDSKWAVMKEGKKSAFRVLETKEEAQVYMKDYYREGMYIEERPQAVKRCNYCMCTKVCQQYTELQSRGLIE